MMKIGALKVLAIILLFVIGVELYLFLTISQRSILPEHLVESNVTVEPQRIDEQPELVNRGAIYINEQSGLEEAQATLVYKGKIVNIVDESSDGSAVNNSITLSLLTLDQTNPKNYDIILDKGQLEVTSILSSEDELLAFTDLSIGDEVMVIIEVDLINQIKPIYSIDIVLVE